MKQNFDNFVILIHQSEKGNPYSLTERNTKVAATYVILWMMLLVKTWRRTDPTDTTLPSLLLQEHWEDPCRRFSCPTGADQNTQTISVIPFLIVLYKQYWRDLLLFTFAPNDSTKYASKSVRLMLLCSTILSGLHRFPFAHYPNIYLFISISIHLSIFYIYIYIYKLYLANGLHEAKMKNLRHCVSCLAQSSGRGCCCCRGFSVTVYIYI